MSSLNRALNACALALSIGIGLGIGDATLLSKDSLATVSAVTVVGSGASLIFDGNSTEAVIRSGSGYSQLCSDSPANANVMVYRSAFTISATYRCVASILVADNQAQHDAFGADPEAVGTLVSVSSDSGGANAQTDGLHYDFFHNTTNLFFTYSTMFSTTGVQCTSSQFASTAGRYVTSSVTLNRVTGDCTFYLDGVELTDTQYAGQKPTQQQTSALPPFSHQVVAIGSRLGKGFVANGTIIALVTMWNERSSQDLQTDVASRPGSSASDMLYMFDLSGPVSTEQSQFDLDTQFGLFAANASQLVVWTANTQQTGYALTDARLNGATCYALVDTSPVACDIPNCGSFTYTAQALAAASYQALAQCAVAASDLSSSTGVDEASSSSTGDESSSTGDESSSTGDESSSTGAESSSTGDESSSSSSTGDESSSSTSEESSSSVDSSSSSSSGSDFSSSTGGDSSSTGAAPASSSTGQESSSTGESSSSTGEESSSTGQESSSSSTGEESSSSTGEEFLSSESSSSSSATAEESSTSSTGEDFSSSLESSTAADFSSSKSSSGTEDSSSSSSGDSQTCTDSCQGPENDSSSSSAKSSSSSSSTGEHQALLSSTSAPSTTSSPFSTSCGSSLGAAATSSSVSSSSSAGTGGSSPATSNSSSSGASVFTSGISTTGIDLSLSHLAVVVLSFIAAFTASF